MLLVAPTSSAVKMVQEAMGEVMPMASTMDLDRDEHVLNNIIRMIAEAPNESMQELWQKKYVEFTSKLKSKVSNV